jgi:predicted Fe-Mo cluster-binding NifX family protein
MALPTCKAISRYLQGDLAVESEACSIGTNTDEPSWMGSTGGGSGCPFQDAHVYAGGTAMIIAFASKNHLGLNSELGSNISQSEYFTVVELEGAKLKRVRNVENVYFKQEVDAGAFAEFIKETKAERLVVSSVENADITKELLKGNVSVDEAREGRIADLLEDFQNSETR